MAQTEFEALRARAEADDSQAMLELAVAYRDGEGIEPDAEEFFEWLQKAADTGLPLLGVIHQAEDYFGYERSA